VPATIAIGVKSEMFAETPSLDAIVNRAHELLAVAVAAHVLDTALQGAA
jgi:hypothetical protein